MEERNIDKVKLTRALPSPSPSSYRNYVRIKAAAQAQI